MVIGLVTTRFSGPTVRGGGINVLAFSDAGSSAQDYVDAVDTFWTSAAAVLSNDLTINIDSDVVTVDETDGSLQGVVATTAPAPTVGAQTSDNMPPATMALIRLITGGVRNNRLIRGRIFVPGICENLSTTLGQPEATLLTPLNNAITALIADPVALSVYSRPSPGQSNGQAPPVLIGSTWTEFAVLRSRRD